MGIEVLLLPPGVASVRAANERPVADGRRDQARTIAEAVALAPGLGLTLLRELSHGGSVRLVFEQTPGRTFTVTVQDTGEVHVESFGRPLAAASADRAVVDGLVPGAVVVGWNPSWEEENP